MEKRYLLPILAVVEAMKFSPDVVMLQSHLPSLPGISKEACRAQVILGQGQVYSCTITTRTGAVLRQHQEAYKVLEQCGDLEWTLSSAPFPSPPNPRAANPNTSTASAKMAPIPVLRVKELSAETLSSLAYPYRRVLLLVDGKRSVEEIARLASNTPQEVIHMLKALEHLIQL